MREQNRLQANVRTNPLRIGAITASPLNDYIEKNAKDEYRGKIQRARYINQKAWQRFTGAAEAEGYSNAAMRKGVIREPVIKDLWSQIAGIEIIDSEFKRHETMSNFGASPDGVFADNPGVLVECKHFEANNMTDMMERREIKLRHRVQMIAQIACFWDWGARACEYIWANLDDEKGECITQVEDLKDGQIQSMRFEPTEAEIKQVLDEVEILDGEIAAKLLMIEKRSIPIHVDEHNNSPG
jgi:hypothetical protein